MSRPTRLALELRRRRTTTAELADAIGYSEHHVSGVAFGHRPASPVFRMLVAEELGLAEEDLFPDVGDEAAS